MFSPFESEFLHRWRVYAPAYPLSFDYPSVRLPFEKTDRRFRSDFCHVPTKTAIELQGGTRSGGKHGRGSGISIDALKLYWAQLNGWMLIQVPSGEIEEYLPLILEAIVSRGGTPVMLVAKQKEHTIATNPF